jgi:DNA-binding CsgD family transcriptional regulator
MALIEREHELNRLDAVLAEARAKRGGTLLIEGPPGIGKTTLLDAARSVAEAAGMRVLSASASELESDLGFSVARSLFDKALISLEEDQRSSVFAGAALLARGPLGLDQDGATTPVELGSAVHGLYWLCANLADLGPLLLAVDDVHWADEPSLLFLTYLTRRASELPLAICATTRPAETEPMRRHLTALHTLSDEVLAPETLSDDGVTRIIADLLAEEAEPEFSAACAKVSGGNPFLLVEMLTALKSDGTQPSADQAARLDELRPEALNRTLLARVARLGPEAGQVATGAAILGIDAEFGRIARLTDLDTDTVSSAIDGLRREGIVTTNGRIGFAHPLIRSAVYSDIPETERAMGHLNAARLLANDGLAKHVARHLLPAARLGDPWVVDQLRTAAEAEMSNGAPDSAAKLLGRALAEPPPESDRTAIDVDLGRALARSGDLTAAAAALERALDRIEDPVGRANVSIELGQVLRLSGQTADSITALDRAAQALTDSQHDLQMSLELEIAMSSHMGLPAKEWIDRVAAAADRATTDSLPDRMMRIFYAYIAASTVRLPAEDVGRLARSGLTTDHTEPPLLLQLAGASLAMSGAASEALHVLDRAIESTQVVGDAVQFGFVSLTRSWMAYRAGRILDLEADARAGLPIAADGALDLPWAASALAMALLERGSAHEAEKVLAEHGLDTTTEPQTAAATSLYCIRSRLHLAHGRPKEALADIERCRDLIEATGLTAPAFVEWRTDLALALLALDNQELARHVTAEDLALSREFGAPRELGMALRISGLIEGGDSGLDLLGESVEVLSRSQASLELAKSQVELGAALRRAGHRAEAQERLREGLDQASRCGSLLTVARARDELTAAGARPRRERLTGLDALTASELRVARMAADGRSNPEIAQALFVTRRTVEVHLTHAYRKLGIDSRNQLASMLTSPE